MRADLKRRLVALEAMPRAEELAPGPDGMVRVGRGLFVPPPVRSVLAWEIEACAQQAALILVEQDALIVGEQ